MLLPYLRVQSEDGATWPQQTGQDFSTNFATPDIDFPEIHMWVDDWNEVRLIAPFMMLPCAGCDRVHRSCLRASHELCACWHSPAPGI